MSRDRRFTIYWLGQTLSGFGDAFALVAVPLLVLEATHSVADMGLVSAAGVAAQVVTSLVSGNVVDRLDRRRLMLICDIGRALVYGLLPLAWWLRGPSLGLLYAVVVAGGILANLFMVSHFSSVPSLVPADRLHSANAKLQGSLALAYVAGTLIAGFVATAWDPVAALWVDAGTFAASFLSLTMIRFDPVPSAHQAGRGRFGEGMRFLVRHRLLRAVTLVLVVIGLTGNIGVGAGVTDMMVFHIKSEIGLGARWVGLCMALTALGGVLGAVSAPKLARRYGAERCFLVGNFVQAAGLVLFGAVDGFAAACVGGLLWGAGMLMRTVPMHSLRQLLVPAELLGRVVAISWTAIFAASALGTAAVTRVAAKLGAAATLRDVGLLIALVGLVAMAGPLTSPQRRSV